MFKKQSADKCTKTINIYNTTSKKNEDIEVKEEVYTAYRRTQWNMNKNDAKHAYNNILFSDMKCPEGESVENFKEFASDDYNPEKIAIEKESDLLSHAMSILNQCATQTQKRRFLLHYYKGLSIRQIAALEGVSHRSVADSIDLTSVKIKIFLKKYSG